MKRIEEQLKSLIDSPDLDMGRLSMISSDNINELIDLSKNFIKGIDTCITSFKKSLEDKNYAKASIEVHNIKGSSSSFGAVGLKEVSVVLENNIRNGEAGDIGFLIERLDEEFHKIKSFFENMKVE